MTGDAGTQCPALGQWWQQAWWWRWLPWWWSLVSLWFAYCWLSGVCNWLPFEPLHILYICVCVAFQGLCWVWDLTPIYRERIEQHRLDLQRRNPQGFVFFDPSICTRLALLRLACLYSISNHSKCGATRIKLNQRVKYWIGDFYLLKLKWFIWGRKLIVWGPCAALHPIEGVFTAMDSIMK